MVLPRGAFTSGDGLTDQFQIFLFDVVQRWLRKTRDYQILRPLNKLHAGVAVAPNPCFGNWCSSGRRRAC